MLSENNPSKNQIFEIIDKLVFVPNIKENNKNKKLDRTIEIMPQLLLIKQKLKLLLLNKQNGNIIDGNNTIVGNQTDYIIFDNDNYWNERHETIINVKGFGDLINYYYLCNHI